MKEMIAHRSGEFRFTVESGDLKINSEIGSSFNSGSVLLAAEKNLIFNGANPRKNYILYSNNLIDNISEQDQEEVDSRLDGSSISIDDLSFNLLTMNENQDLLPSAWFDTLLKNNPENQSWICLPCNQVGLFTWISRRLYS